MAAPSSSSASGLVNGLQAYKHRANGGGSAVSLATPWLWPICVQRTVALAGLWLAFVVADAVTGDTVFAISATRSILAVWANILLQTMDVNNEWYWQAVDHARCVGLQLAVAVVCMATACLALCAYMGAAIFILCTAAHQFAWCRDNAMVVFLAIFCTSLSPPVCIFVMLFCQEWDETYANNRTWSIILPDDGQEIDIVRVYRFFSDGSVLVIYGGDFAMVFVGRRRMLSVSLDASTLVGRSIRDILYYGYDILDWASLAARVAAACMVCAIVRMASV